MSERDHQAADLISNGKALALAIKGLQAIGDVSNGYGTVETKVRSQLINLYQRELREILEKVPKKEFNEILSIIGPSKGTITVDPSLN